MKIKNLLSLSLAAATFAFASCDKTMDEEPLDEIQNFEESSLKSTESWVLESQTNFPEMSVPSWHWMRSKERKVDTYVSTHFNGSTLPQGWIRHNYENASSGSGFNYNKIQWTGQRNSLVTGQPFPFAFALWEDDANWASKVEGGKLVLRVYWDNNQNKFLGGFVRTEQKYADGLFQIKSYINKSEKGWVHGFWTFDSQHEIDIYEIKGTGKSGNDERTHMPTNFHRSLWSQATGLVDQIPNMGKTITGLPSAENGSTYACLKTSDYVEFFNNGNLVRRETKGQNQYLDEVFSHPQRIILNSEYQNWIADPSNKTAVAEHKIEYFARYKW